MALAAVPSSSGTAGVGLVVGMVLWAAGGAGVACCWAVSEQGVLSAGHLLEVFRVPAAAVAAVVVQHKAIGEGFGSERLIGEAVRAAHSAVDAEASVSAAVGAAAPFPAARGHDDGACP